MYVLGEIFSSWSWGVLCQGPPCYEGSPEKHCSALCRQSSAWAEDLRPLILGHWGYKLYWRREEGKRIVQQNLQCSAAEFLPSHALSCWKSSHQHACTLVRHCGGECSRALRWQWLLETAWTLTKTVPATLAISVCCQQDSRLWANVLEWHSIPEWHLNSDLFAESYHKAFMFRSVCR